MTRKEYEELHRVVSDKLGHQHEVDDLVIGYAYSNNVELYRVKKLCAKKVVVVRVSNNVWTDYIYPDRLIKIKEDGIPEN
jgi:hypothetical protein